MQDLNQWLTLIANIAVVGGLVFLALEVRHNSKVSQIQTHTELMNVGHEIHNWKRDPQFAEVVVKAKEGFSELSPSEQEQFSTFVFELLNLWEHVMSAYRKGLMTESYWIAWNDTFHPNLSNPSWLTVWNSAKTYFSAEFQEHVDSYI
jgi:hypothetical protein